MDVKIDGLDSIEIMLNSIPDNLEQVVGKACALVERDATIKAPKRTGHLRQNIGSKVENKGDVIEGTVFATPEYAPYVEWGTGLFAESGGRQTPWAYEDPKTGEVVWTSGQKPQPYMRPALNENREKIINFIRRGLSK